MAAGIGLGLVAAVILITVFAVAPAKIEPVEPEFTLDKYFDALLRSWAVVEVCYDAKSRQYLFNVPPHPHRDDTLDEGWYMTTSYKFVELSNNSLVLEHASRSDKIYPDTTGLLCKQQAADPSWFN